MPYLNNTSLQNQLDKTFNTSSRRVASHLQEYSPIRVPVDGSLSISNTETITPPPITEQTVNVDSIRQQIMTKNIKTVDRFSSPVLPRNLVLMDTPTGAYCIYKVASSGLVEEKLNREFYSDKEALNYVNKITEQSA